VGFTGANAVGKDPDFCEAPRTTTRRSATEGVAKLTLECQIFGRNAEGAPETTVFARFQEEKTERLGLVKISVA
jgi:hypothetical protein